MITITKHVNNEFGTLLSAKMQSKKISRSELGKIVGIHRTTISDYILGKYLPKEEIFYRIHQVFPDKDLYDAYFTAVNPTSKMRKQKQLIPVATPYNYYKAEAELMKAAEARGKSAQAVPKDNEENKYIFLALDYMVRHFEATGMHIYAPSDYAAYKKLKEKYAEQK